MRRAWLLCCAVGLAPAAHAETLNFADAVARAAVDGPTITAQSAAVDAAQRMIRPAGRLPDPQLVLGIDSFPVSGPNAGSLTRDDFTMQRVGIMQEMESGAARRARTAVAAAEAERAGAGLEVAQLQARLGAAGAWLNLHFALERQSLLERVARDGRALADASRARLSAGGGSVDEALAAEIDAARLSDRMADAGALVAASRAELHRWVGDLADEPLAPDIPVFAVDPEQLRAHLHHHPELAAFDSAMAEAEANVGVARAATHPDWSWEVAYQHRDPAFGDYVSAEVRIGLPLFGRQRPVIDARRADAARVSAERDAMVRERTALLESRLAEYAALTGNLARARDVRLPLARQREAAAIASHAAGTLPLAQLIAARRDARETELDVLAMRERLATIGATLTLEYGDIAP